LGSHRHGGGREGRRDGGRTGWLAHIGYILDLTLEAVAEAPEEGRSEEWREEGARRVGR